MGTGTLTGRTAVVTGAGQGLGRAIAQAFVEAGARVAVVDIDGSAAEAAAAELGQDGNTVVALQADVADADAVAAMAEGVRDRLGPAHVVCNNAGVLDDFAPLMDVTEALWDRVLGVNLKGQFLVSRALAPHMVENGGGVFVNIASMAGTIAGAGGLAYTASKHGVIGLTRQISLDYGAQGIRANAICPGSMDTEMSRAFLANAPEVQEIVDSVPAGRQGRPDEVAALATYLAGDQSAFICGAAIVIDGGWTIR